jgi:hypothetical protein
MAIDSLVDLEQPLFGQLVRQIVRLRSEQLEDCLEQQRQFGGKLALGQILLNQGLVTRDQIADILRFQARWVANSLRADIEPDDFPFPTFVSVCLPAYNEEANIEDTLDAARVILPEFVKQFEIVVVNDGSQDTTAVRLARYAERDARVRVITHEINRGYGAAICSGLRAAQGDLVLFTDSDGQFSLLNLPWFLSRMKDFDYVVGYRYRRADPWHRRMNGWLWNRLIRRCLGVCVRDLDCAFKVFRRDVIERLSLTATGAAINAEILAQCRQMNLKFCQIPVSHFPRYAGAPSGAALKVIMRAFRELPQLWKYRAPLPALESNVGTAITSQQNSSFEIENSKLDSPMEESVTIGS